MLHFLLQEFECFLEIIAEGCLGQLIYGEVLPHKVLGDHLGAPAVGRLQERVEARYGGFDAGGSRRAGADEVAPDGRLKEQSHRRDSGRGRR